VRNPLAPTLVATFGDSPARNVPRESSRLTRVEAQVIVNTDDNFWANVDSDEFFDNFEERKSRAAYRINQAGFAKKKHFFYSYPSNINSKPQLKACKQSGPAVQDSKIYCLTTKNWRGKTTRTSHELF